MFLGILTLITALTISAVAIYYSVAGLVAIFAAAAIPVMIMGSVLEVAKLVTAVWLHKYWSQTVWWLKLYLSVSVFVLMAITSMGIFGFLSKAHIEQTAKAGQSVQQIEQIDSLIDREKSLIERANLQIETLRTSSNSRDTEVQDQITLEQQRIDSAYDRIQPSVQEQRTIIDREIEKRTREINNLQSQYDAAQTELANLRTALADSDVRKAQGIVGVRQDGALGPNTEDAIDQFRTQKEQDLVRIQADIETVQSRNNPLIDAARGEITRLRSAVEQQISNSNQLIERLREQVGQTDFDEVQTKIDQQEQLIDQSNNKIDSLIEEKYTLEAEYRKLEAEVGPIKYIAEFIYGETDKDLLEEAVRWVIVMIIFVFDPLAVLLLIASQYTFELYRSKKQELLPVQEETVDTIKKKEDEFVDPKEILKSYRDQKILQESRIKLLAQKEREPNFLNAKEQWKKDNPTETLKTYKNLYIQGKIDSLPWENYQS